MDTRRSGVDVPPPWMLVESTGDSEVDARIGHPSDCDDDDAQSCICDEPGDFEPDCLGELCRCCDEVDAAEDQKKEEKAAPPLAQEEIRGCRRNSGCVESKGVPILCHKSSASIDSTEEEKNRLFWEACLAS